MVKKSYLEMDFTQEPQSRLVLADYPEESKQFIRYLAFCILSKQLNKYAELKFSPDDFYKYLEVEENFDIKNSTFDYQPVFERVLFKQVNL